MLEIRKNSNEYFFAKSKAFNVLFYSTFNKGLYEKTTVQSEYWSFNTTLFRDGRCYVLKDISGSYHRWSF